MSDSTLLPRLRHCTFVEESESDRIHAVFGDENFSIEVADGGGSLFLQAKRYFDGRHTVAEASRLLNASEDDLRSLASTFQDLGFLRPVPKSDAIATAEFIRVLNDTCKAWGRQIGYHRLFRQLDAGTLPREVFQGLMVETYHYVKSAPRHIATAIAHSRDDRGTALLSRYLEEEHDHAGLALDVVARVGIDPVQAAASHPTVGTLALINMLCDIGRQSTLAYLACTLLLEARREDGVASRGYVEELCTRYGYPSNAAESLLRHMEADLDAGHVGLLAPALEGVEAVSRAEADLAANLLHDLKHSFDVLHDQVLEYYSGPTNYIPRVKLDFASL